jgi:hypothetical protein
MRKRKWLSFLFFTFLGIHSYSQSKDDLTAITLSPELVENANMVIRNHDLTVDVKSIDQMTIHSTMVVTVLNKVGHEYVNTAVFYDNHTKVTQAEAQMYDATGSSIKKYRKGDFADVSAVDGGTLYSDSRVKYIEFTPISYPYTMVFEFELKTTSTSNMPRWNPIPNFFVSVEKSSYTVNYPPELGVQTKEKNFKDLAIENNSTEGQVHYTAQKLFPIVYESSAPPLDELRPHLMITLNNLNADGVRGSYQNWDDFGDWMRDQILVGKDQIDQATKDKILALTADAKTDIEKAKIVYKYVQGKTRYISVQVGIGGIQPIAANQVDKVGYGDCKGLTNYTKALLDVVGVESNYVHVEAGSEDIISLEKDFASLEQGNHVILNIPNGDEDIWLECTSQSMPFGYLGDFTDNRDVLVVTSEGGVIKRTPSYLNEDNVRTTKATIELDPQGNLTSNVTMISKGIRYDYRYFLENEPLSELKKYYKTKLWGYNNNLNVQSVTHENNRDSIIFTENLDVDIASYASVNSSDYLIKVNVFNRDNYVPKRYRNRKYPLKIERGYKDINEYTFKIPEGYSIEMLPADKIIESKFGKYQVTFQKQDNNTFTYHKSLLIKAGEYPKEDYKRYRKFRKSIAKYENLRISLTKTP